MSSPAPARRNLVARIIAWALVRKPTRAFLRYGERRGPMLADSITYRALFSVFAGVLLVFSVAAVWLAGNPAAWQALIRGIDSVIPGLVGENGLVDTSTIAAPASFTIAGVLSLVGLVGAAIGAIGALRSALRTLADQVHDDVVWYFVLLRNLALAIGFGVALLASVVATFFATAGLGLLADLWGLDSGFATAATWAASVMVVFALDTVVVAAAFRFLSGVRAPAAALWPGALLGGFGLTVLQQFSGLFVGGASSNPLLVTFASLIALLLWLNLSSQVVMIAASYIVTGVEDHVDRVRARHGAETFAQRRVRVAENAVAVAVTELEGARDAERAERGAAD